MSKQTRKTNRVTEVFCSSRPTTDKRFFVGRENELYGLSRALLTPGKHAVVYGDRGVGKTSLAKMAIKSFCEAEGYISIEYRCSNAETPESLVYKLLSHTNNLIPDYKTTRTYKRNLSAKAKVPIAEAGANTSRGEDVEVSNILKQRLNPDYVATSLQQCKIVYFLDEFDQVGNTDSTDFLAQVMKNSSDCDSKLKIVVSGVANSFQQLFGAHASISRCLDSFALPSMNDNELGQIIANGLNAVKLKFSEDLKDYIVWLSSGLPYCTHLLCEEISVNAIFNEKQSADIEDMLIVAQDIVGKIPGAAADEYSSMEEEYYPELPAMLGRPTPTLIKRYIIHSMALVKNRDADDILKMYHKLFKISKESLPSEFAYDSEGQVELVLNEISAQSKLIAATDDKYEFENPFYRVYSLLQCANEIGVPLSKLLEDVR